MFIAEAALLQAVRDKLVADLGLNDQQCQVEPDNLLPDYAPKLFLAVSPAGVSAGPRHRSSGGVVDIVVAVKVTVYKRITDVARDKRKSVFLQLLSGLAPYLELVTRSLDNNYPVLASAIDLITAALPEGTPAVTENETGKFLEPFRTFNPELSARAVLRDTYDAASGAQPPADPIVAMARSITFTGARYMQVRSQWPV